MAEGYKHCPHIQDIRKSCFFRPNSVWSHLLLWHSGHRVIQSCTEISRFAQLQSSKHRARGLHRMNSESTPKRLVFKSSETSTYKLESAQENQFPYIRCASQNMQAFRAAVHAWHATLPDKPMLVSPCNLITGTK